MNVNENPAHPVPESDNDLLAIEEGFLDWVRERLSDSRWKWTVPDALYRDYCKFMESLEEPPCTRQQFADLLAQTFAIHEIDGRIFANVGLRPEVRLKKPHGKYIRR